MNFDTEGCSHEWVQLSSEREFNNIAEGTVIRIRFGDKTVEGKYRPGLNKRRFIDQGIPGMGLLFLNVEAVLGKRGTIEVYRRKVRVSDQIKALPAGSIVRDRMIDATYLIIHTDSGPAFVQTRNGRVRRDWDSWDREFPQDAWDVIYMGGTA